MDQGFNVEFYAKADYVKHFNTRTGTPMVVGSLSAYVYKAGYVNIGFKCFGEEAERISDNVFIKGNGILVFNTYDKEQTRYLQITIKNFELAEKPPFIDYTKEVKENNYDTNYTKKKKTEPKKDTTDLEEELFGDIPIDDFPF